MSILSRKGFISLIGILFILVLKTESSYSSYETIFNWKILDYKFRSLEHKNRLLNLGKFIPTNNAIAGIKVSGHRVFLTVPRWREGVPSTLNYVCLNETQHPASPPLIPYPSWELQEVGDCSSLQYVQSMEIDQFGRMWVLDVGRINIQTIPDNSCPPKLLLIDLKTDEVIHQYLFPNSVVGHNTSFLNDIVVGCKADGKDYCWAYISDTNDAKLVIYNLKENRSWFVKHESMAADPNAIVISILGENVTFKGDINGIALSPMDSSFDRVYYRPHSSYHLYSVSTSVLKEATNGANLSNSHVVNHINTGSQIDGLAIDSRGYLFCGLLANNSLAYFKTSEEKIENNSIEVLAKNDEDLQWIDTYGFDNEGYLYFTSNRIHKYEANSLDFNEINFRVVRIIIGSKSYMYSSKDRISMENDDNDSQTKIKLGWVNR